MNSTKIEMNTIISQLLQLFADNLLIVFLIVGAIGILLFTVIFLIVRLRKKGGKQKGYAVEDEILYAQSEFIIK